MDWKIEQIVVPVSDVDRARDFYAERVGFNLDVDHRAGDFRVVQLTPPGSGCSIALMKNEESAGTLQGLHLVVRDLDAAQSQLAPLASTAAASSTSTPGRRPTGPIRGGPTTGRSSRSATPTGTVGLSKRCRAGPADSAAQRAASFTTSVLGWGGPSASTQRTSM